MSLSAVPRGRDHRPQTPVARETGAPAGHAQGRREPQSRNGDPTECLTRRRCRGSQRWEVTRDGGDDWGSGPAARQGPGAPRSSDKLLVPAAPHTGRPGGGTGSHTKPREKRTENTTKASRPTTCPLRRGGPRDPDAAAAAMRLPQRHSHACSDDKRNARNKTRVGLSSGKNLQEKTHCPQGADSMAGADPPCLKDGRLRRDRAPARGPQRRPLGPSLPQPPWPPRPHFRDI